MTIRDPRIDPQRATFSSAVGLCASVLRRKVIKQRVAEHRRRAANG